MKTGQLSLWCSICLVALGCQDIKKQNTKTEPSSMEVAKGKITMYQDFPSNYIAPRNVEIYFPPQYNSNRKYPVLYMHDGQNVFNPETSYTKIDWGVDEAMDSLIAAKKVRPAIVVAIWNKHRREEYMPQKPNPNIRSLHIGEEYHNLEIENLSNNYLKFIVEELKPYIDSTYSTLSDRDNTFLMGSSMGGLISVYGLCEYPEVFGGAACLSTHWQADDGKFLRTYLPEALPAPDHHRIYFDYGTATLDQYYEPYQTEVDAIMEKKNYKQGDNWITKKFSGAEHNERAWRARIHIPLEFLLENHLSNQPSH